MPGRFSMHGSLTVSVKNHKLMLVGEGPWNLESLQLKDPSIMAQVKSLYGAPWGVLGLFSGEAVYVPEAVQTLKKQVKGEIALGRIATAIVFKDVVAPQLSKHQFESIYHAEGHELAFFDTVEAADPWLTNKINQN